MRNVFTTNKMAFTVFLSVSVAGCGIKWATNKVLTNRDAIEQVGAVYDALTPKDTTERLVFIQGDSIITELHDTSYIKSTDTVRQRDTIRIRVVKNTLRTDTLIKQLPPDNRELNRLKGAVANYKAIEASMQGQLIQYKEQAKTAEKRLIWMAAGILLLGVIVGLLLRFKIIPNRI